MVQVIHTLIDHSEFREEKQTLKYIKDFIYPTVDSTEYWIESCLRPMNARK